MKKQKYSAAQRVRLQLPISAGSQIHRPCREGVAARRIQAKIDRIKAKPLWRIQTFLDGVGGPCTLKSIAEGLGMPNVNLQMAFERRHGREGCQSWPRARDHFRCWREWRPSVLAGRATREMPLFTPG